jgi:hypothetical protein
MRPLDYHYGLIVQYPDCSKDYRSKRVYRTHKLAMDRVAQMTLEDPEISCIAVRQVCMMTQADWALPDERSRLRLDSDTQKGPGVVQITGRACFPDVD